ncbi:hypothetical protein B9T31_14545 [Acinetobacter sp. ANC 4558]|uniref:DUF4123 domain-containing protein n=1 Tax=Acinetobacter sp. ANC 4558 TaxID=1977876 RepID=UPI000A32FC38|nr:DUF4123 domain-containing protein [Acinetobacter sp. ANC 4558]OTG82512.1 hypothetical protein B9T31_14545 [Acinetobacter sp. ANC 4558]
MIKEYTTVELLDIFTTKVLEDPNLNIYVLADAAQESKFLKAFTHLRQKCLIIEAAGEKARAVSPHLLQMPIDFFANEWQWIQKNAAGTSIITIIVSGLSFKSLFDHLRCFLEIQLEGGLDLFLAFWDPAILATLVGNKEDTSLYVQGSLFNEKQIQDLLTPIHSWWYWNRVAQLQKIIGFNQYLEKRPIIKTPIQFTVEQEEQMIEATLPDNLIYYLKLNNGFLVDHLDTQALYKMIIDNLPKARKIGLSGTRDLVNFMCLKLVYKDQFDTDTQLQSILNDVEKAKISMDDAMQKIMNMK